MAKFEPRFDQIDSFAEDLKKLGQLTNEDAWTILAPAGEFLRVKLIEKIRTIFKQRTGKLAEAITSMKKANGDGPYIQVYPYGTHHTYHSRVKYREYKNSVHGRMSKRGGGVRKATADEVAFILEYGTNGAGYNRKGNLRGVPRKAYHWMENTINENVDEIHEKMQEGFDTLCDEKGVGT